MIEYPKVIEKKGKGKFYNEENSYESDFEIFSYPERNLITTKSPTGLDTYHLFTDMGLWSFSGELNDGTKVQSEGLMLTEFVNESYRFLIVKEIFFGNKDLEIEYAKFPLIGFYEGNIDFNQEDWEVTSSKANGYEIKHAKRISKIWQIQSETRELNLKNKKSIQRDAYIKKAISISNLLSLATGNETTFHRQLFFSKNGECLEIWRKRIDYQFGIDSIIESKNISKYLEQTLTNFENLELNKKGALIRAIEYMNSATYGYLEDRIFRIALAWELTSLEFTPTIELSPELQKLKKELKTTVKVWNKEFPTHNKNGIITDRVLKSLNWEKLISQIEKFSESENLNIERIGLDFRELKELRDNVAHTGKFKDKWDSVHLTQIIEKAILGLRILILRINSYSGEIQEANENFLIRKEILEFIKPPTKT